VPPFGPQFARRIRARLGSRGDRWFLGEVVVSIGGKRRYLWRAVDQDGDALDILVQKRKDKSAAKRFFRKLLKGQGQLPLDITTDKLGSYAWQSGRLCPRCRIAETATPTIERRFPMSTPGRVSGTCEDFEVTAMRSAF
jgi:transposase-like protein